MRLPLPLQNTPIQEIQDPLLQPTGVRLYIKREDLTHPVISGNKWYKLKYNLQQAKLQGFNTAMSFGGAHSNHLHAFAEACFQLGIQSIGIVRGELKAPLTPTLNDCLQNGMLLQSLTRADYRRRHERQFHEELMQIHGDCYLVPEGGSNRLAVLGCVEIVHQIDSQKDFDFDLLCCACGSGGTMAGLIFGLNGRKKILGFPALKETQHVRESIRRLLKQMTNSPPTNWDLESDYHFGGFAKMKPELVRFMDRFHQVTQIPLDPIYTSKMMYGLYEKILRGDFPPQTKILALHSGGLQGNRGMNIR